jgi:3-deoxy-D-manno-octulosonic-acid transferase
VNAAWALYRFFAPGIGALAPWAKVLASPAERPLWNERMGAAYLEGGCHAWVHSASLGEAVAVGPLVEELLALQPRARLYLTATTRSGRARLRALGQPASLAPIDSPQAARRFFRGVQPERLILVETELWPHWLIRARLQRVPVVVVSGRLSERSVRRYALLGAGLRGLVRDLAGVMCQTEADRSRWIALGARPERTLVVGNLKHDALPSGPPDRAVARARCGLDRDRPALVLGSVRPGEARMIATAWRALPDVERRQWQVVAVPRHARASAEIRREAEAASIGDAGERPPSGESWRWDDRPGVLAGYYAAADVAIVCGSLGPYHGHNPMEPAACGCAVIVGRNHRTQASSVRELQRADAVDVVADVAELTEALRRLVLEPETRAGRGRRALDVVRAVRGGAKRAAAQLATWDLWPVE